MSDPYDDPAYREYRQWVKEHRPVCGICHEPGATEVDHLLPVRHGGTSDISNLRPAHRKCNRRRGSADDEVRAARNTIIAAEIEACTRCDSRGLVEVDSRGVTLVMAKCTHP